MRRHHLDPHKGLGQNFLVDHKALRKIVDYAGLTKEDTVLEIGAGLGSLTRMLAKGAGKVVAVEIDHHLVPILEEVMAPFNNVQIIEGDILELNPVNLMGEKPFIVVANIPYFITSAIIRHLLTSAVKPTRIVLTMQKEVAERICAQAGDLSLLALSVQVFGIPKIGVSISASAFFPPPKVDSATLKVEIYEQPLITGKQLDMFFTLAKIGFSQKRKMLRNTISAGLHCSASEAEELLKSAGIDPARRAQTLELVEWKTLVGEYESWLEKKKTTVE
ncbi:MAG: ribosomal RNA small subunit methyltransferase A [Chloroflexi bacterium HGW-Chloroflexi-4]|jgi:16S rRNA (adenine1518-N6/adenine1519-N6)-dimethyltransferase|nr:MAG: ribosomal RNA small subunit methyltransferase A [Chloroflexi bacterium HGW-Chloroflexi-4]